MTNVKNGENNQDVVNKSQLDKKTVLLDGARPAYTTNDKAVIYSGTGAVHAKSFYLQNNDEDEARIMTDNQDYDNGHLYVPNLKNYDGFGGTRRSEVMVTSVDQTIPGKKGFQDIKVPTPTENAEAEPKSCVDGEISKINTSQFVKKAGDTMTGDLILTQNSYPVQGNTNKAISYETIREVFLLRREDFPMQTDIDMYIKNMLMIEQIYVSKKGNTLIGDLDMNNHATKN